MHSSFRQSTQLIPGSVLQLPAYTISAKINIAQGLGPGHVALRARQITLIAAEVQKLSKSGRLLRSPSTLVGQRFIRPLQAASDEITKTALVPFGRAIPDPELAEHSVHQLMLHAISQTTIANYQSASLNIYSQDEYMMNDCGQLRSKTLVYSEKLRYGFEHAVTNFRTPLGSLFTRRTVISQVDKPTGEMIESQMITTRVFYPARWLHLTGLHQGLETITASASRSWLFNCRLNVIRAVPKDSLIFEFCRDGNIRAVATLLRDGRGSVVDTSPDGWKPLHVSARSNA